MLRACRTSAGVWLPLLVWLWHASVPGGAVPAGHLRSDGSTNNCSAVLEQGSAYVKWRESGPPLKVSPDAAYCVIQQFDNTKMRQCLERRYRRDGALFNAYFVGDSRMRDLYARFSSHAGANKEEGRAKDNCLEWIERTYAPGEAPHGRDHWCSYRRQGDHVTLTYLSRNLVDSRYLDSLRQLVERCQRAECPDLLLVNGGMHALWHNVANHSVRGVQQFGQQMHQLAPTLQQLSELGVTVLWVLNEPIMEDAGGGFIRMQTEVAWLMNQVALSVLRDSGGVLVWSSHLPVAVWYQEVCRAFDYPTQAGFNCHDAIHLDDFAYDNYIDILMNFICDDLTVMPESNCCGINN